MSSTYFKPVVNGTRTSTTGRLMLVPVDQNHKFAFKSSFFVAPLESGRHPIVHRSHLPGMGEQKVQINRDLRLLAVVTMDGKQYYVSLKGGNSFHNAVVMYLTSNPGIDVHIPSDRLNDTKFVRMDDITIISELQSRALSMVTDKLEADKMSRLYDRQRSDVKLNLNADRALNQPTQKQPNDKLDSVVLDIEFQLSTSPGIDNRLLNSLVMKYGADLIDVVSHAKKNQERMSLNKRAWNNLATAMITTIKQHTGNTTQQ